MPFDGTQIVTPELRRAILANALRGPMPDGFVWSYASWFAKVHCGTAGCAIGLAHLIWPDAELIDHGSPSYDRLCSFFGMTEDEAAGCFWTGHPETGLVSDVTPGMVADRLDAFVA